jgi:transmembrane sensor
MDPKDIEDLFERYVNGKATPEERALVETWYLTSSDKKADIPQGQAETDQQESLNTILSQINPVRHLWPRIAAAASILLIISIGSWFFLLHKNISANQYANNRVIRKQIVPGGNKAFITLSDGTNIALGDAKAGKLAEQGHVQISQTKDGQIHYSGIGPAIGQSAGDQVMYNTAFTPRGGQYEFVLADGTKVWLNASSSIRFPVAFTGNERRVQITGEAYFEVAHNAAMPFRVEARGQTVEVLGTHFNVNAYDDEASVKTTLLEGSVKVSTPGGSKIIRPGEQSDFKDGKLKVSEVDVDNVVAWKNGYFSFKDDDLRTVMRQIGRWYDVDIIYEGNLPERRFSGEIARNLNIAQMLDVLTFKNVHYKITGNQITIKP